MPNLSPIQTSTLYHVERSRQEITGLVQLPVSGPPPQVSVIARIHAPYEVEVVSWVAVRQGAPPVVPTPVSLGYNRVYLRGTQTAIVPIPTSSGVHEEWAIAGVYYYAIKRPESLTSNMPLGKVPWGLPSPDNQYIPSTCFSNVNMPTGAAYPPPLV